MTVHFAKITSKAQTTVPAEVRKALKAGPGDTLAYTVGPTGIMVSKAEPLDWDYLSSLEKTLGEWSSAEDGAAFDDL